MARLQQDCWYFLKEQVRNTPSFRDGINHIKELGYRQQCANFIQEIGQRLTVYISCFCLSFDVELEEGSSLCSSRLAHSFIEVV